MSEFEAEKSATGKSPCDCGCGDCGDKAKPAAVEAQPDNNRRKFLLGGVIVTPAVTMLSSRAALANACSASAHASVNLSKPNVTASCLSLSPGCWKNSLAWPSGFYPGLPDPITGSYFAPYSSDANLLTFFTNACNPKTTQAGQTRLTAFKAKRDIATLCTAYFPWAPSGLTMKQAMWTGGGGTASLLRHACAGLLSAVQFGEPAFGYTPAAFVQMVNDRYAANDPQLQADVEWLGGDRGNPQCPNPKDNNINWCQFLNVG